ncbi:hypothetical protein BJ138DRAFT_371007 [Hygrophoropsis aurantiaca]|uniref:Uncharacterized protein n=1 Tax=Hygrophoropsis aurantiaca TaxID=72124 RepID=A0ACB8A4C4_9AGAM|nr:hypothetical protein BJ138DRAFT_371007 [Hygrophoropsis aurantiaca]
MRYVSQHICCIPLCTRGENTPNNELLFGIHGSVTEPPPHTCLMFTNRTIPLLHRPSSSRAMSQRMTDDIPPGIHLDTSYVSRPPTPNELPEYEPEPRTQRQNRIRDVTWISSSQWQHSHSSPAPSRHISASQTERTHITTSQPASEFEWENMTISMQGEADNSNSNIYKYQSDGLVEHDLGYAPGVSEVKTGGSGGAKNFVGGFVSGLKRLPKVMSKGRLRERKATTTQNAANTFEPGFSALPRYRSNPQLKSAPPVHLPRVQHQHTESTDMPSVESAPEHPLSPQRPISHRISLHESASATGNGNGNGNFNEDASSHSRPRERLPLSAVHEHFSERSVIHDDRSGGALGLDIPPHSFHPSAEAIASPILASPKPGSDFAKMESPIRAPSDTSLGSQLLRMQQFVRELVELPWVASPVSVQYKPGDSRRAKLNRRRDLKPSASWYQSRRDRSIDLLAGSPNRSQSADFFARSASPPRPAETASDPPPSVPVQPQPTYHPAALPFRVLSPAFFSQRHERSRSPSIDGILSSHGSVDSHGNPLYSHRAYVTQPIFVYPSGIVAGHPTGIVAGQPTGILPGPPSHPGRVPHHHHHTGRHDEPLLFYPPPPAVSRLSSSGSGSSSGSEERGRAGRPIYLVAPPQPVFMPPRQDRGSPHRSRSPVQAS